MVSENVGMRPEDHQQQRTVRTSPDTGFYIRVLARNADFEQADADPDRKTGINRVFDDGMM